MSSEKYMNVPSSDDAMEMGEQQSKKSSMGSIAGSDNDTLRTLDEPVTRTIMRDLKMIATKLRYVLMPRGGTEETLKSLRDWDLCTSSALISSTLLHEYYCNGTLGDFFCHLNLGLLQGALFFFA
eukprot:gb/GECG01007893.1/.p1 GENE.gb/GECG01007893.1/~~gb/GECG01007893.1/.p1  ORF type:complete len:125 (+),score=15.30 gb/GECG01007893.1/:1-375(+)